MFWVCQVSFEPLLGVTGHYGGLLGPACLASHREKFPYAASGLISLDTSYGPDVFLTLVYFCIFSHMGISM